MILTHPGGAHKDDFLACSLLISLNEEEVQRREPTEADLADPGTWVVDVGGEWNSARKNFDHHQFPRESEPQCALSLILKELGLYEEARAFCDWLEPAEWFDTRGPVETAKWMGIDPALLGKLNSPIDITLLRRFAASEKLSPGEPLWEIMKMIGDDLREYLVGMRSQLGALEQVCQFWTLDSGKQVVFLPKDNPLEVTSSMGIDRLVRQLGKEETVVGMVTPDRRGEGYGLARFRDSKSLEFTRILGEPEVHFAHAQGFVAKTSATDPARLLELLEMSWVPEKVEV